VSVTKEELAILPRIAKAVSDLPFGEHPALPWCRESFPYLDAAICDWEALLEKKGG
jgi:hypothetical protein